MHEIPPGMDTPNKQKPVKNTRLFGLFHKSDPSLSCDNSRVVEVIVDDLIMGLGLSFYTQKLEFISRDEQGIFTWENHFSPIFFNYIFKIPGKGGGYIIDF